MAYDAKRMHEAKVVKIYKDSTDTKLGVTFYRADPQDAGNPQAAIISRLTSPSPADGLLFVGDRILAVDRLEVDGPLAAARMLRGSTGYISIRKLDKRPDFDENYERYAQIELENAKRAMEQALPGQAPQRTPRSDIYTPRGPGASGSMPLLTGLKVIGGPGASPGASGGLGLNMQQLSDNLSQQSQKLGQDLSQQWGQLSARTMNFFQNVGELLPTEENKKKKAALKIQKAFRAWSARGHFHEERGAVLMLQAAARRKKAQNTADYKKALIDWAAITIQVATKKHQAVKKKKAEVAKKAELKAARGGGVLGKLSRSLSFSKRKNKDKESATPRGGDTTDGSTTASTTSSEPSPNAEAPAAAPKKRSLSFTRRKNKPAAAPDEAHQVQNV